MTEKIGTIKNPLTIIAIFAGIAEVSGTAILPFIGSDNQIVFVYFLICFPTLLVLVFFLTLNFNNKVLYAPSDYRNEENYFRLLKYDSIRKEQVQLDSSSLNQTKILYEQFIELSQSLNSKVQLIESKITKSESAKEIKEDKNIYAYDMSNLPKANVFIALMSQKGFFFNIYKRPFDENEEIPVSSLKEHKAIWVGKNVPLEISKEVIIEAKKFFPHLQYIQISGDLNEDVPVETHDQIFVGGATSTAEKIYHLNQIPADSFNKIKDLESSDELFEFVRKFYPLS